MSKIFVKFFPILDYLYIDQVLEYDWRKFFVWFIQHPFARNLQKKHHLVLTRKAFYFLILTLSEILFTAIILARFIFHQELFLPLLFLILLPITPIFLILSQFFYYPLDTLIKKEVLNKAQQKLRLLKNLKIIVITGSYGKTSTKEMLYTLLKKEFRTVKTPKNYNTLLGIAQTILEDLKPTTEIFIVEMGAYKKGDIARLTKFLNPSIGIITAIAKQHLEKFGSLENILSAKFELVENLASNGIVFLNGNDQEIIEFSQKRFSKLKSLVFYGRPSDPFFISHIKRGETCSSFLFHTPLDVSSVSIPLLGEHHAKNFLAAAVVARRVGLSLEQIKKRANLCLPIPHRLEITRRGNLIIIDNTYNTNPDSARSSLKLLQGYKDKQRILVTPGLVELGPESSSENQSFAQDAAQIANWIIIVGQSFKKDLLLGLEKVDFPKKYILFTLSTQEAFQLLPKIVSKETVVLLENDLPDQYF